MQLTYPGHFVENHKVAAVFNRTTAMPRSKIKTCRCLSGESIEVGKFFAVHVVKIRNEQVTLRIRCLSGETIYHNDRKSEVTLQNALQILAAQRLAESGVNP